MSVDSVIVACPSCRARNRVDRTRSDRQPVCGRCKTTLTVPGDTPLIVTDSTFQATVLNSTLPVMLDCWAPWCGPCRMVAPVMEKLAHDYSGLATIAKLNVDENPGVASQFSIQSIPTILLFKGGRVVDRIVGAVPRAELIRRLNPLLAG